VSRLELAWWVLFWASGAVALLRWPGRTLGLIAAVMAWTAVGPWAAGVSFAATVVGAVGWRLSGRSGGGLVARPRWAACVLAAAATVLAPGWWLALALVTLVASSWWLMAAEILAPRTPAPRWAPLASRPRREPSPPAGDAVAEQTDVLVAEIEDFLSSGDGGAERGAA
jgi:hypothetical protein